MIGVQGQPEGPAAAAARVLAQLHRQISAARAELARLRQDVMEAEEHLGGSQAAQLLAANEQLVVAALRAQANADTAAQALALASRSAELDALTELPNRALLLDRLTQAIAGARRHATLLALLFVDLDDFTAINDTFGRAAGDELLKRVARCLTASVREADTVSRYGGDEFVILLTQVAQASDSQRICAEVSAAIALPHPVGDQLLRVTASIGISIYPDDGDDAQTLIDRADAAIVRPMRGGVDGFAAGSDDAWAEPGAQPLESGSLVRPLSRDQLALARQEHRREQQQEANEQLVLAALGAQDLQAVAEQAQQRQTNFMTMLAHELRNPLTPLRAAAALLGRIRSDEPQLLKLQAIIERQVVSMSRLVNDLLDVSRARTGKLRLERQRVDLSRMLDEAIQACRPAMEARAQDFSAEVPSSPLEMHGDPLRLTQIISNLLDNASKYTPDGGRIALSVVVAGDTVELTVTDSGIGITPQTVPHVFEPFVQDPHAIGFNGIGMGIGLTVVRELVEAHGGTVDASSAGAGQGSRFVVTLPLIGSPAAGAD